MGAGVYVLVFGGLFVALLATVAAISVPAPRHAVEDEAGLSLTLLGLGSLATVITGVLALADLPVHSAVCGALACVIVIPCLWLARAPLPPPQDADDDEDDDDGGTPPPVYPSAPPAPDDGLPSLGPPAMPAARPASAPAPAHSFTLPAAPSVARAATPATCAARPAEQPPARRRLEPQPRRARADHRSVVHKRAAAPHAGRRRRASLRRRVLRRCRGWLWPETVVSEDTHRLRQLVCDPGDRVPALVAQWDSPGASSSRAEGGGRPHECRVFVSVSVGDAQPPTAPDHRPCGLQASEGAVHHTQPLAHPHVAQGAVRRVDPARDTI